MKSLSNKQTELLRKMVEEGYVAHGGGGFYFRLAKNGTTYPKENIAGTLYALERKGLVERYFRFGDCHHFRATEAGKKLFSA